MTDLHLHHCDPATEARQRRETIAAARGFLGAKWRHRGRTTWAMDCIGLLVLALREAGYPIVDRLDYGREPWKDGLQQALEARFHAVGRDHEDQWQPGDVALFYWPGKAPCHLGFLADYRHGGLSILHAHSNFNVAEHALVDKWRRLLVEVYSPWPR